jgi:hypothetical protein
MLDQSDALQYDRSTILGEVVGILNAMTSDWDNDFEEEIGPRTRLMADLGCESWDLVQLALRLEERLQQPGLPFHELIMTPDGRYVEDIQIAELVEFLHTSVNTPRWEGSGGDSSWG